MTPPVCEHSGLQVAACKRGLCDCFDHPEETTVTDTDPLAARLHVAIDRCREAGLTPIGVTLASAHRKEPDGALNFITAIWGLPVMGAGQDGIVVAP